VAPAGARKPFRSENWLEGGSAVLDRSGRIVEINDALCNWLGGTRASLAGERFWSLIGHLSEAIEPELRAFHQSGGPFARFDLETPAKGSQAAHWFNLEVVLARNILFVRLESVMPPRAELEDGAWDEHLPNEAARREMFMRMVRAEARWDSLMRRWPCVIFSQRPDFSLHLASPNIEELTGVPLEKWSRDSDCFWQVVHESDANELQRQFKSAVQTGAPITNTYRIRHVRTGRVMYILEHRQPTLTQNGLLLSFEVIWLDVTRQVVAEKRLSSTAWKETLGVLTLGMAHDFRNMMSGIQSLSEGFLEDVDQQHRFYEGLSLIKSSSMQAIQLVNAIVNLHLGQPGERSYQDVKQVAADLGDLVGKILPRRVRFDRELAAESLPVYVDLVEFRQSVINLLINAADAMPNGGTLTLRTSRHTKLPASATNLKTRLRLPCVCLSVRDTGVGIKERHLASIFDPFFTTKPEGSGLGLYNARIAIEKHGGSITVESKEGEGTAFRVWLPEADFSENEPKPIEITDRQGVRRTLLLYGRGGGMLDRTAEFLRSNNYLVAVSNAADGVWELLQSDDYQFSGIMLMVEPGDRELSLMLQQLRQESKNLKTILNFAGCNEDDLESELLDGVDLLLKSDTIQADVIARLKHLFAPTPYLPCQK